MHLSTSVNICFIINNVKGSDQDVTFPDTFSVGPPVLELISVHSKITVMQRLINVNIEKSRVHAAGESILISYSVVDPVLSFICNFMLLKLHFLFLYLDYQREWRQKAELLRRKILQLNREESNSELSKCAT